MSGLNLLIPSHQLTTSQLAVPGQDMLRLHLLYAVYYGSERLNTCGHAGVERNYPVVFGFHGFRNELSVLVLDSLVVS